MLFVLFWLSVGCCIGYVLASAVYAGKLADERARIEANAVNRLKALQQNGHR